MATSKKSPKPSDRGVVRAYLGGFKQHPTSMKLDLGKQIKAADVTLSVPEVKKVPAVQAVKAIHAGLPIHELEELRIRLDMSLETLAPRIGLSKATLHRRKLEGRLRPDESDRVVRYARLMGKAIEVMEDEDTARQWMTSPQVGLGGATPMDFADTEVGAREVEDLLGRIEYGVYS